MMDSSIKKNQGRCPVIISLFSFADALLGETLAMDVRILAEEATVEDFLTALDQFAAAQLADCRGCDGCCHERAPLIAADIPRLAGLPRAIRSACAYGLQQSCSAHRKRRRCCGYHHAPPGGWRLQFPAAHGKILLHLAGAAICLSQPFLYA